MSLSDIFSTIVGSVFLFGPVVLGVSFLVYLYCIKSDNLTDQQVIDKFMEKVLRPIADRTIGVAEALDEAGNAALGPVKSINAAGSPHYTMSQRWAYERKAGASVVGQFTYKKACVICKLLSILFKPFNWKVKGYDHCQSAIDGFDPNLPWSG